MRVNQRQITSPSKHPPYHHCPTSSHHLQLDELLQAQGGGNDNLDDRRHWSKILEVPALKYCLKVKEVTRTDNATVTAVDRRQDYDVHVITLVDLSQMHHSTNYYTKVPQSMQY